MNDIWFINISAFVIEKKIHVVVLGVASVKFGVNHTNASEMVSTFDCRTRLDRSVSDHCVAVLQCCGHKPVCN